jgi:hypothetical protein
MNLLIKLLHELEINILIFIATPNPKHARFLSEPSLLVHENDKAFIKNKS